MRPQPYLVTSVSLDAGAFSREGPQLSWLPAVTGRRVASRVRVPGRRHPAARLAGLSGSMREGAHGRWGRVDRPGEGGYHQQCTVCTQVDTPIV